MAIPLSADEKFGGVVSYKIAADEGVDPPYVLGLLATRFLALATSMVG